MSTQRGANVEETVHDFWTNRPVRPIRGRWFAGVAAGIGRRYGIDPIIVRVVLVVSAFYGGAGVLCYLLGWLLLPKQGDEVSAFEAMVGRGRSSIRAPFTILLCIALIPASSFVLGGHVTQIVGAALLVAALYVLHRSRAGYVPPAATTPPSANTEVGSMSPGAAGDSQQTEQIRPPNWDPLGAAPFAWDLPEPGPAPEDTPPPPAPRHRSRVGLVTTGVVLVTLGAMALLEPYTAGWLGAAHVVGIVTGIVGLGLVAGSFTHSGRWLVVPALLLSLVSVGMTMVSDRGHLPNLSPRNSGDITYRPTSVADVLPTYDHGVGDTILDLTDLPNSGSVTTSIHLNAGDVTVRVPRDAQVTATCHNTAGDIDCLGQHSNGTDINTGPITVGTPGNADGLKITLDASVGVGDLEVSRG